MTEVVVVETRMYLLVNTWSNCGHITGDRERERERERKREREDERKKKTVSKKERNRQETPIIIKKRKRRRHHQGAVTRISSHTRVPGWSARTRSTFQTDA